MIEAVIIVNALVSFVVFGMIKSVGLNSPTSDIPALKVLSLFPVINVIFLAVFTLALIVEGKKEFYNGRIVVYFQETLLVEIRKALSGQKAPQKQYRPLQWAYDSDEEQTRIEKLWESESQ